MPSPNTWSRGIVSERNLEGNPGRLVVPQLIGISGRIIVPFIVAFVLSFATATTAGAANAPGETIFALSEALALAQSDGPGFAQARLQARSRELESAFEDAEDRKSTHLNSSHVAISY